MKKNKLNIFYKTFAISTAIGIVPISFLLSCTSKTKDSSDIQITFDAGEGQIVSGSSLVKVSKDSKTTFGNITKPTVKATNKIFAGWTITDSTGKQVQINDSEVISNSLTVKANYADNESGSYWTITFNSITGSYLTGNNVVAVKNNIPFFTVNRPIATKDNATFKHWSTTEGGTAFSELTNIQQNYVLYPVFATTITITYGTPTGAPADFAYLGPTSVKATSGDAFSTIGRPNPVATGYHFDGWYKDATCTSGQEVAETDTFDSDQNLYPKMTANT